MNSKNSIIRTVTITATESLSEVIDKSHYSEMLIIMPAGWTAADITFSVSDSAGGTFSDLHYGSDGVEVVATVAAGTVVGLDGKLKEALAVAPFVKLRSGTSAIPVAQTADRIFKIILMRW